MPARDTYHDAVVHALEKEGWTVTHDPYVLQIDPDFLFVDLAAERIIAAERGPDRITVEIKSFVGNSDVREFELAVGQYNVYRTFIDEEDPDRRLFLAVPDDIFLRLFQRRIAAAVV